MKRMAAFLFLLIAAGSCNSFQHAHYSRLKKVPADGIPAKEKNRIDDQQLVSSGTTATDDSLSSSVPATDVHASPAVIQKAVPVQKNEEKKITKPVKNIRQLIVPVHPKRPDKEFGILASVFIFIFASFLVFSGGALLVFGLLNAVNWMILVGLLYLLIGAGPVWSFLKSAFSYRRKHDPEELRRQQM